MTERELAARLGITQAYLNRIASGKKNCTVRQLERIAAALGTTLHISFEDDDGP